MAAKESSFEADIKPLFREKDRDSMRNAFDLWSYADVQTARRRDRRACEEWLHAVRRRMARRTGRVVRALDRARHAGIASGALRCAAFGYVAQAGPERDSLGRFLSLGCSYSRPRSWGKSCRRWMHLAATSHRGTHNDLSGVSPWRSAVRAFSSRGVLKAMCSCSSTDHISRKRCWVIPLKS